MNREEALDIVKSAREDNKFPDLSGAHLSDADLRGADLRGADLYDANLRGANLYGADLRGASLSGADLYDANLRCAHLSGAHLSGANLRGANLRGANLYDARWGGLEINHLPSGTLHLTPTPGGWRITLGCWYGTPEQLRDLIAQDQGWPEAEGDEITRRRPYIEAALALCDLHMRDHEDIIPTLAEKWTSTENNP